MDTSKVIRGVVNSGRYTVTAPIVKEDYGLKLKIDGVELPSTYQVDFSNDEHHGTSVTMIGNSDGVLIPRQFIDSGKDVFAFLYHVGADYGRTVYKFRIPNKCRPDRTDDTPTPEEQSVIDQAINALNEAVAQTAQDVIDADASAQESAESARASANSAVQASLSESNAERAKGNAQASAESASASATASAQSASDAETARQAATSLVAEAQGYADASEQSATASANSAEQAESAKGVAQSYAQDAQTSATYASLSESTASTKASEASGYASTASQKATESAQSASHALGYKNDAESAKTASQTAQGLAESARDSAISAKNDSESARDEAQTIVDGINAKASQIDANTAGIASLSKDKAPVITDTASGAIASFTDGADNLPLKSLVIDINPVQDLSQGDPSPENICPISGWNGANVSRTGKNLLDNTGINDYTTWEDLGSNRYQKVLDFIKGGETYTVSGKATQALSTTYLYLQKYVNGVWELECGLWQNNVNRMPYTFVASNAPYRIWAYNASASISIIDWIQIEVGNSATDYEPYKGRTIPISWQTEAGTVYGGKLDVLSGVLTVDKASFKVSDVAWTRYSTEGNYKFYHRPSNIKPGENIRIGVSISSAYPIVAFNDLINTPNAFSDSANSTGRISVYDSEYASSTAEEFAAGRADVRFVYPLATPIEIQLTSVQVNSLLGVNNIFADTGDVSVEYRADTKLYIERLTEPDADMIADSNIVSGQYFMVGNNLYKATANIANGGQIIIGTNATRISLAQALNEING